jgi:hypothetical protein
VAATKCVTTSWTVPRSSAAEKGAARMWVGARMKVGVRMEEAEEGFPAKEVERRLGWEADRYCRSGLWKIKFVSALITTEK